MSSPSVQEAVVKFEPGGTRYGYCYDNGWGRDLTPTQKAAVAVEALPFFEAEAEKRELAGVKYDNDLTAKLQESSKGQARDNATLKQFLPIPIRKNFLNGAKSGRARTDITQNFQGSSKGEACQHAGTDTPKMEEREKGEAAEHATQNLFP
jgi:hypothetical protein